MTQEAKTLGQKLANETAQKPRGNAKAFMRNTFLAMLKYILLLAMVALPAWWIAAAPQMSINAMFVLWAVLFGMWIYAAWVSRRLKAPKDRGEAKVHSLLAHDRNGFMGDLQLDAKTAVFDGSNVYHFGHEHGLDAQPLGLLAQQLRVEGYRIVCFFDANIFYTLQEHGAFEEDAKHSEAMLTEIFGLAHDEIYVVPSGVQADLFVLNTLKHLPISFAVTNDKFRDYAKQYRGVMKGQWRKGVKISNGELKLLQHKLQAAIRVPK
jgi:hypothetical protein